MIKDIKLVNPKPGDVIWVMLENPNLPPIKASEYLKVSTEKIKGAFPNNNILVGFSLLDLKTSPSFSLTFWKFPIYMIKAYRVMLQSFFSKKKSSV